MSRQMTHNWEEIGDRIHGGLDYRWHEGSLWVPNLLPFHLVLLN